MCPVRTSSPVLQALTSPAFLLLYNCIDRTDFRSSSSPCSLNAHPAHSALVSGAAWGPGQLLQQLPQLADFQSCARGLLCACSQSFCWNVPIPQNNVPASVNLACHAWAKPLQPCAPRFASYVRDLCSLLVQTAQGRGSPKPAAHCRRRCPAHSVKPCSACELHLPMP